MSVKQHTRRDGELSREDLAIANKAFADAMKALQLDQHDALEQEALARLIVRLVKTSNPRGASAICDQAVRMSAVVQPMRSRRR